VIVAIAVMYTIMMIIHVSVAELLVFEIQSKHWNQLGNWTSHAHQTTEPLNGHLQVPGVNPVTVDSSGQIITPINVVYKFLKNFFLRRGKEMQSLTNKYINETWDFDESDTPSGGL